MQHAISWFEIPASNLDRAQENAQMLGQEVLARLQRYCTIGAATAPASQTVRLVA